METLWSAAVFLVLGAWLLASVVHQFRRPWWSRVARFDALNLLPRWSFFAPNPGRHDIHVVFRDWTDDQPGTWWELSAAGADRRWRWLWHPARYPRKGVNDLANGLLRAVRSNEDLPRSALLSRPYIGLLSWVMAQPWREGRTGHRQFAVVSTHGFGEDRRVEVLYVSERHRIAT